MAEKCPGFFANHREHQLVMDLLLMERLDPFATSQIQPDLSDALRAIGITDINFEQKTSAALPMMRLTEVEPDLAPELQSRTVALWGQRQAIADANDEFQYYGGSTDQAVAHHVDGHILGFLVTLAIGGFLSVIEAKYSELRDRARNQHAAFKPGGIRQLRDSMLTLSLDLTSVKRDVENYRSHAWRSFDVAPFMAEYEPWIIAENEAAGRKAREPRNLNDRIADNQAETFTRLIEADREYRDILATVASLGASVDSLGIARRALWIALASLVVAGATLLVANMGDQSVLRAVLNLLAHIG
ncbi:hypothetical protein CELL_03380 [Cellulomonas sp. T2.31MG-18]